MFNQMSLSCSDIYLNQYKCIYALHLVRPVTIRRQVSHDSCLYRRMPFPGRFINSDYIRASRFRMRAPLSRIEHCTDRTTYHDLAQLSILRLKSRDLVSAGTYTHEIRFPQGCPGRNEKNAAPSPVSFSVISKILFLQRGTLKLEIQTIRKRQEYVNRLRDNKSGEKN